MAIASITQWLQDPARRFQHGKLLYEQYGDNPVILAIISSGSGSFHMNKLQLALQELNSRADLAPKPITVPDYVPAAPISEKGKTDLKGAPELILDIRDEKNHNFAQARKLHQSVPFMDSREHRLTAALQILNLMDKVNESWATLDKFVKDDVLPEPAAPEPTFDAAALSFADLLKESKNLPTYITKSKKKILEAKNADKKLKFTLQLEQHEQRLAQVKERMANATL